MAYSGVRVYTSRTRFCAVQRLTSELACEKKAEFISALGDLRSSSFDYREALALHSQLENGLPEWDDVAA